MLWHGSMWPASSSLRPDMALTVLLTGFGPFPGAPFNPTGALVQQLARSRHPGLANVRLASHVFPTSYRAVDRDLPRLLADVKPDALLMFGLSGRASCLRIETRARNALSAFRDVEGQRSLITRILPGGADALRFGIPATRLALAVRNAGMPAAISRDAGRYLCNYLSWRAIDATTLPDGPKFAAFIHVPKVRQGARSRHSGQKRWWRTADLVRGGEAILLAAVAETRRRSHIQNR
jgi:pyroglutamyl-peptidase